MSLADGVGGVEECLGNIAIGLYGNGRMSNDRMFVQPISLLLQHQKSCVLIYCLEESHTVSMLLTRKKMLFTYSTTTEIVGQIMLKYTVEEASYFIASPGTVLVS